METSEEEEEPGRLLKARLRVAVISLAESEARKRGLSISQPVMTALCSLTQSYIEQLAKEVELFAHHAGRKSVNMDDVLLAARRNEDIAAKLKELSQELTKNKEQQQAERKRKKTATAGASKSLVID